MCVWRAIVDKGEEEGDTAIEGGREREGERERAGGERARHREGEREGGESV